jgi:hypothetical protein
MGGTSYAASRFGGSASFMRPAAVTPIEAFYSENSLATTISGDGNVIYGEFVWSGAQSPMDAGSQTFRWTASGGTQLLSSIAAVTATTDDGSLALLANGNIYRHAQGDSITVATLLSESSVSFAGWSNMLATHISGDGRTLAGTGTWSNAGGPSTPQSWVVTIPVPGAVMAVAAGAMCVARRRRTSTAAA